MSTTTTPIAAATASIRRDQPSTRSTRPRRSPRRRWNPHRRRRPPPADRIYVKRRLQFIGAPTPTPTGPPHSVTGDHLTSRTLRRLSRSPFAPIPPEVPVFRTDLLCRLVIERLASIGPLPEGECSTRSTGEHQAEGTEVISYAQQRASSAACRPTTPFCSRPSAPRRHSPHDDRALQQPHPDVLDPFGLEPIGQRCRRCRRHGNAARHTAR